MSSLTYFYAVYCHILLSDLDFPAIYQSWRPVGIPKKCQKMISVVIEIYKIMGFDQPNYLNPKPSQTRNNTVVTSNLRPESFKDHDFVGFDQLRRVLSDRKWSDHETYEVTLKK